MEELGCPPLKCLAWLPNGESLVFAACNFVGHFDCGSKESRPLFEADSPIMWLDVLEKESLVLIMTEKG